MKQSYVVALALACTFAVSFVRPKPNNEHVLVTKLPVSKLGVLQARGPIGPDVFTPVLFFALQESTYVLLFELLTTVFGYEQQAGMSPKYKAIMQDMEIRELDRSAK